MTKKCQTCDSPAPHLRPAVQHGGEVQVCRDRFHSKITPQNTPERIAAAAAVRWNDRRPSIER
jgi:hypothetical protein